MRSLHSDKIQTDSSDETLPFVPEEGDFGRFDRIYHEYAARLIVFARRFVTEKFAEDIVQDVFVPGLAAGAFPSAVRGVEPLSLPQRIECLPEFHSA